MIKKTYILAFLLCSILSYSQQISFQENVNYRANVLLQTLDEDGENLLLESKTEQIIKVDIFNDDFSESIDVYSNSTKIDLKTLPAGNFVIQARLGQKRIIMYLEKSDDVKLASSEYKEKNNTIKLTSPNPNEYHKDLKLKSSNQINTLDSKTIIAQRESDKIVKQNDSPFYWVVTESNSNFGSSKSMRLEYKEDIAKLISKIKLELKSKVGKNNKLLVYEIYDRSQFMTMQLRNSGYYQSETSEFFNVVPVYESINLTTNIDTSSTVCTNENLADD